MQALTQSIFHRAREQSILSTILALFIMTGPACTSRKKKPAIAKETSPVVMPRTENATTTALANDAALRPINLTHVQLRVLGMT